MKNNKIAIRLYIIAIISCFIMSGFQLVIKSQIRLKLDQSLVKQGTGSVITGEMEIFNCGTDTIRIPKYVGAGYEGDVFNDYYFDILDSKKNVIKTNKIHYPSVENPSVIIPVAPGNSFKYKLHVIHYPIQKPGIYYLRVVFCNEMAFLGASDFIKLSVKRSK